MNGFVEGRVPEGDYWIECPNPSSFRVGDDLLATSYNAVSANFASGRVGLCQSSKIAPAGCIIPTLGLAIHEATAIEAANIRAIRQSAISNFAPLFHAVMN